jgi:hypothetical protein
MEKAKIGVYEYPGTVQASWDSPQTFLETWTSRKVARNTAMLRFYIISLHFSNLGADAD